MARSGTPDKINIVKIPLCIQQQRDVHLKISSLTWVISLVSQVMFNMNDNILQNRKECEATWWPTHPLCGSDWIWSRSQTNKAFGGEEEKKQEKKRMFSPWLEKGNRQIE